jgi:membrane protein DedA with SNARE-associated domain
LTALITQFGPLGVFILMVPESACIPVPSEVTLLFSGFAVSQGWMNLPLAILAATGGNVVGSLLAYGLGTTRLADRLPGAERSKKLLGDRPMRSVFLARLLPLARTFVSLPAGQRRLPLIPFTALTAAGCALWATGFLLAGLAAGRAYASVGSAAGKIGLGIAVTLAVLAVIRAARRRKVSPVLERSRGARR